jgi:four helix bundle protein
MTNGQMTNGQMSELTEVGREVEAMSDVQRWLLRESVGTGYNIYERVFQFAVRVVRFVRTFPRTLDAVEVGRQLVRSATSVGANLEEADGATTRRDFLYRLSLCRKEARETRFWLRLCQASEIGDAAEANSLYQESDEIVRILSGIIASTKRKMNEQ